MTKTFRPGWLFVLLALLAGLTLAFGAACGGGDDDDDDGPTATEETDGENEEESPDEEEEEEQEEEPTEDSGDDGGEDSDLQDALDDLSSEIEDIQGRVTYEVTSGGETSTMTYYADGSRSRIDFSSADGASIFINTPEASYTCFGDGSTGQCIKGEGSDDPGANLLPFVQQYTDPEQLAALVDTFGDADVDFYNEEIAGVDASCFEYNGTIDEQTGLGKYCFSEENGLLLLVEFEGESDIDTYRMEATEASGDVSDSDFEPPYEVLDLGEIGQ